MAKETFEKKLERLKTVVETLERGDLPLEEGVALYKEGLVLVKGCGSQLDHARNDVRIVSEGLVKEFDALNALGDETEDGL
ncbi:exodeoxyribonuclease VII small subunit [Pseudodesulfovibrio sp. JC047]|uniref:exodeoxyribonuclease VII small subunit n=1 Tax=Pseudodesulfovibrio sp. JC047 TaxID=2683199 RepID=UPI0013D4E55D|nr:exodeoxyribonuclease VII small subunit [Pseudodesulfovibrio sp. JC047]NDV20791.1 exodeoxyribonuclease VII small subunit [Pseudodesulfovibrio sp. JC047]